jgi:hypothetical protein
VGKALSSLLALGLAAGLVGFAVYFFGFGQTFEGDVRISERPTYPESSDWSPSNPAFATDASSPTRCSSTGLQIHPRSTEARLY